MEPSYDVDVNAPRPLSVLPVPLMFTTRKEPSSRALTEEGNQPVGIDPANFHASPDFSTTAMALVPAQAT